MSFNLKDVLSAIGPAASIVFAAWIFMGFLQQRYTAAHERYRSLISQYRNGDSSGDRHGNIKDQVKIYKRRFELMKTATNIGLMAAILLISALIAGALDVVFPGFSPLKYVGTGCALAGLALVIVGAVLVIMENSIIQRAIDSELLDVPDLARETGQEAGDINDPTREG